MNTRKKRIKALKKAAKYSTAASGAVGSAMDCIGLFVVMPGFVKWTAIALVGITAGCVGCHSSTSEEDEQEQKAIIEVEERQVGLTLTREMHQDLAEIKKELEYHHELLAAASESKDTERLKHVRLQLDKWVELARIHKRQREEKTSVSSVGLFAPHPMESKLLPAAPGPMSMENNVGLGLGV